MNEFRFDLKQLFLATTLFACCCGLFGLNSSIPFGDNLTWLHFCLATSALGFFGAAIGTFSHRALMGFIWGAGVFAAMTIFYFFVNYIHSHPNVFR